MKYVKVDKTNLDLAINVQTRIFPQESACIEITNVVYDEKDYNEYYLVYNSNNLIGITGIYAAEEDIYQNNTIWMGWFGILKDFRKKEYGKKVLLDTIEMAKELAKEYPIRYFRLYTSTRDNKESIILYNKMMDMKEEYNNIYDINYDNTCVIYTKILGNWKKEKWDSRNLNIKDMVKNLNKK